MTGEGFVALDVALFISILGAWLAHLYHLPACWRESRHLYVGSALRMVGWVCLSARYWNALLLEGDILIPIAAEFALLFIAFGDTWSVLARRKVNPP